MKPFSPSSKTPPSPRSLTWRPRTADEIARKKNRRVISQHLKRIGRAAGHELSLDQNGVCIFTFKKFVVVVEVPEDKSNVLLFYTKVCHVRPEDNIDEVRRVIEVFNERQGTGGNRSRSSTTLSSSQELADSSSSSETTCFPSEPLPLHGTTRLGMKDDEEVNLCFTVPIQNLTYQDTADYLERFIKLAVLANRKLYKAKALPVSFSLPEEAPPSPPSPRRCCRPRMWSLDSQTSVSELSQMGLFSLFSRS